MANGDLEDTKFEPRDDEVFGSYTHDGEERHFCNDEVALAKLLIDEVCFVNTRPYIDLKITGHDKDGKMTTEWDLDIKPNEVGGRETVVVFVLCNDVFVWGCADAEEIKTSEIEELYRFHMADKKWGRVKWVCKRRNRQPQRPIVKDMKKDGVWDDMMKSLRKNRS